MTAPLSRRRSASGYPRYKKPYASFVDGIVAGQAGCRAVAVTNVPPGWLP
jgi:hypothetical protein